jgi:hypothetical protein
MRTKVRSLFDIKLGALVILGLGVAILLTLSSFIFSSRASAEFDPSYIISDTTFTAKGTMSEAQIQAFLVAKGSYLANYYEERDSYIGPNNNIPAKGWRASKIIWHAANWYGINPQVILATLQKEQSLVTDPSPADWAIEWAMGYGCPDSSPCASYPGLAKQVDMGTWQLWYNMYYANIGDSRVAPYLTGNTITIDGTSVYLGNGATASSYRYTPHFHGNQNFYSIFNLWFTAVPDLKIINLRPTNVTENNRPLISADLVGSIVPSSTVITLDGADVSAGATRTKTYVSYRPQSLGAGQHSVHISVTDSWGNTKTADWSFDVAQSNYTPHDYYWTWYDCKWGRNWVLAANPASSGESSYLDIYLAGKFMSLNPFAPTNTRCPGLCGAGQALPGETVAADYAGVVGGPTILSSLTGTKAIVSQRILWGENSFEEVAGFDMERLSDHYYWTWYDQVSAGYKNWVLVANPNTFPVYYEIRIAGSPVKNGTIAPGGNVTPTFPGTMGGPVEVEAWTGLGGAPAQVISSQRVLSNNGEAFNEQTGIPAEELSHHYVWTWYDNKSSGASNWVLVSNYNDFSVYYEIRIGGGLVKCGTIPPESNVTPTFPGIMGGPVEVQTWTSKGGVPAKVIASQRIVWGPSFGEVPGYPVRDLNSSYAWTWYDQQSSGAANWVLVSNPNAFPVYYEVKIAGNVLWSATIPAGKNSTPTFPGTMGGSVEVQAWTAPGGQPANILASQRVLWNGYFNEMLGSVLVENPGAQSSIPHAAMVTPESNPDPEATTVTSDATFEVREGSGTLLTTLDAAQTVSVTYDGGAYSVEASNGYTHVGNSYIRMNPTGSGILQVSSYHDVASWDPGIDDNKFHGSVEVRYSPVSDATWVVNELPVEEYLKGIAETGSGAPTDYYQAMTVAARSYALWHLDHGGKYGAAEIFHLKNSRNGNGDDQVYKGYGLEVRFPELATAVSSTSGQAVTYGGNVAMTSYFSNSDGRTRSAQEVWNTTDWPWLQSVADPDGNGMVSSGHGVGMSGDGAYNRAERGDSYAAILDYYYANTGLQQVNTDTTIRIAITSVTP